MWKKYNKVFFAPDEPLVSGSGVELDDDEFNDLFGEIPIAEQEEETPSLVDGEESNNTSQDDEQDPESPPPDTSAAEEPSGQEPADGTTEGEESEKPVEGEKTPPVEPDPTERLLGVINQLTGGSKPPTDGAAPAAETSLPTVDFSKVFDESFDFDKVVDTKQGFVDFFTRAMTEVQKQTVAGMTSVLPTYVTGAVKQYSSLQEVHNEFYSTYPELSKIKGYVGQVASTISSENPDLPLQEILEKTATQVRETLGLDSLKKPNSETPAPPPPGKKPAPPALPGASNTRQSSKPKKNQLADEIEDLLSD